MHETLVNVEEMGRAIDQGNYFRIPADSRDLNYKKYFYEGQKNAIKKDIAINTQNKLED